MKPATDLIIVKLDAALRLLVEAKTIQQHHTVIAIAASAETFAKQQGLGEEAIGYAHWIKIYALRNLGKMLKATERNKGTAGLGRPKLGGAKRELPKSPTLSDLGIDKKISSLAQQIAALPMEKVKAVADRVQSITQVQREQRAERIRHEVSLPDAKYRVIYADPPWSYGNNQQDSFGEQRDHYPVMPLEEICAMPVNEIAEDNSVLFLWVTSPILEESFEVINAWGFDYKASFVWDKVKHVMGHYNSVRHELLLIATRGSGVPETPRLYDSVVSEERGAHSEKPVVFYEIIESLYPHGKRIELFARCERAGWDKYGFES